LTNLAGTINVGVRYLEPNVWLYGARRVSHHAGDGRLSVHD
jgi:hypothetical protein